MNWPSPVFGRFQNGFNKVVIELSGVQFWSEIILVISNRTRAARSFDFEITRMISDQIALHSVQLPLWMIFLILQRVLNVECCRRYAVWIIANFGHIKQGRLIFNLVMNETSCKSHEISQNSLGDTTCFLHEDHRKKFNRNVERYALYKEKDRVRKRESRKKALSPRTVTLEIEIQRKTELVDTWCKSNEISQNGLRDTTCFLLRPFQIPEQPPVEKLFKLIMKHERV